MSEAAADPGRFEKNRVSSADRAHEAGAKLIVGVDVGRYKSQLCILQPDTGQFAEINVSSTAEAIADALARYCAQIKYVVLEATSNSFDLCRRLIASGWPALLIDARDAAPFLRAYRHAKTDKNDAFGLAQLVAHKAHRTVWARSAESSELSAMLATRDALIKAEIALRNALVAHLDSRGITIKSRGRAKSLRLYEQSLRKLNGYTFLNGLYVLLNHLHTQIGKLSTVLNEKAAKGTVSSLLMSIPGVGPLTALRYISLIDDPRRFARSRDVGSYLGLIPRVRQSGNTLKMGGLTRRGSSDLRKSLYLCAQVVLTRSRKDGPLRDWGTRVARRRGTKRAIVALARKLAVIMHAVWSSGKSYGGSRTSPRKRIRRAIA